MSARTPLASSVRCGSSGSDAGLVRQARQRVRDWNARANSPAEVLDAGWLGQCAGVCCACCHSRRVPGQGCQDVTGCQVSPPLPVSSSGADIEQLGLGRGHRTLTITRKGGKVVTIPLAPRTARAIGLAVGERADVPVFVAPDGRRLDRHGAGRIVRKVARRAGIGKAVTPHTLRHAFITAAPYQFGCRVPLRDVQEAPRTQIRGPRCGMTAPAAAWTGTRPTSSPRLSRAPPGRPRRRATVPPGGHSRQAGSLAAK
jgi:Phage integrase family